MKYFIIFVCLIFAINGKAQHFEKLGEGIRVKTFYHQQGIDFNISETDTKGNIYHLFYDTVTSGFNFGQEYIKVRLQIFDGISWLFSKPIKLYAKKDVLAPRILDLQWYNNALYICGSFDSSENNSGGGIIKFTNNTWQNANLRLFKSNITQTLVNRFYAFNNQLLVTGDFDSIPGFRANGISIYNGSIWETIGSAGKVGFNGLNNYSNTYFEVSSDSLYVYKRNNIGDDSITVGDKKIFKMGVFRNNRFEPVKPPLNRISNILTYSGQVAVIELSPLFYAKYLTVNKAGTWERYALPDSFYSVNFIGSAEANNALYLVVQNPNTTALDIYKFDGNRIAKSQSWKIANSYINLNSVKFTNGLILGGNFRRINNAVFSDSFRNIARLSFNPATLITGTACIDMNGNGIKDAGEKALPNCTIFSSDFKYVAYSNSQGVYTMFLPLNSSVTINASNPYGYASAFASTFVNTKDSIYKADIGFADSDLKDIAIGLYCKTANKAKQGFKVNYTTGLRNFQSTNDNINIKVTLPKGFKALLADNFTILTQNSGGFIFNANLGPHALHNFTFSCVYPVDSFVIGESVQLLAEIQKPDKHVDNNTDTLHQVIVSAYDPNIKVASPSEVITNRKVIRYVIYYQNEGNDTAINVTIVDSLEGLLNAGSITLNDNWSKFSIDNNNNFVWRFENINLPPKKTDAINSAGSVSFSLNMTSNAKVGDTVFNKASIYFDYQKPVITNSAKVIFKKNSKIAGLKKYDKFVIYPNPAKDCFRYDNNGHLKGQLQIIDMSGKLVLETELMEKGDVMLPANMDNGVYIVKISDKEDAFGKLIISR